MRQSLTQFHYALLLAIAGLFFFLYVSKLGGHVSTASIKEEYVACLNAHFAQMGLYYSRYKHNTSDLIASWNRSPYEMNVDAKMFAVLPSLEAKDIGKVAVYAVLSSTVYNGSHPQRYFGIEYRRYHDLAFASVWRMMAFSRKSNLPVTSRSCSPVYNEKIADEGRFVLAVKCEFPQSMSLNHHGDIERVQLTAFALNGDANTFASPSVRLCDHSGVFKKVNMAMCLHVYGGDVVRAKQWIVYHLSIGFELIVMYVAQGDQGYNRFVKTYAGMFGDALVFINMNIDGSNGQLLQFAAQHECIFRMRGIARWLALGDIDEYFAPVGKSSQRPLLDVLESAHQHIGPSLGGVYFPAWLMVPINVTGMARYPHLEISESALPIREWKWRVAQPWHDWVQKSIVRPDNVDYFTVHQIVVGGPNYTCDPVNECAMLHYRWPPRVPEKRRGRWFTTEYYTHFSDTIGKRLAQNMDELS